MSKQADLRGFHYALEPLLRKQQWELDALQARLGRAEKMLGEARQAHEQLERAWEERTQQMKQALAEGLDPARYAAALAQLAQMCAATDASERELKQLADAKRQLGEEWKKQHMKLDLTERHKAERLDEYIRSEQNRAGSELDREWIARCHQTMLQPGLYSAHTEEGNPA